MAGFQDVLEGLEMNQERYVGLLTKLVSVVDTLQNNPSQGMTPREDNASDFVLEALKPYTIEEGGVLEVERVHFTEGRGNVIVKYAGTGDRCVTFLGSHLDVVPANPEMWTVDPFKLTRDGDKLYGRGTTDCLGHVAMLTELMTLLAETKPTLDRTVLVVFICNEENSEIEDIGIDQLNASGKLAELRVASGPVIWVDSADGQPCVGTAGNLQWSIKAIGKLFHSGLPHKSINPLELCMEAVAHIQRRFYADFPPHEMEALYNYKTPSTMKPTQMECARGSLNQIPPHATISGDCRVTPFYKVANVKAKIAQYVEELNADPSQLPSRGPCSKYVLPDEDRKGILELTWVFGGEDGIACSLESEGNGALRQATQDVTGEATPFSISGSLPLVRWMQDNGFDVQIVGYGLSSRYHADDEYCSLEGMARAIRILSRVIAKLNIPTG